MGRTLFQAVPDRGRWVALLMWGPAALKLTDRDADSGWTDHQRAERIGLVVQNRRFLVLAKTRMPHLAIPRVALIAVKFRQGVTLSWPRILEQCAHSTVSAITMIHGISIKLKDRGKAHPPRTD